MLKCQRIFRISFARFSERFWREITFGQNATNSCKYIKLSQYSGKGYLYDMKRSKVLVPILPAAKPKKSPYKRTKVNKIKEHCNKPPLISNKTEIKNQSLVNLKLLFQTLIWDQSSYWKCSFEGHEVKILSKNIVNFRIIVIMTGWPSEW